LQGDQINGSEDGSLREGADEIFGDYLYFHKAPDPKAFHEETVRKISNYIYMMPACKQILSRLGVKSVLFSIKNLWMLQCDLIQRIR